MNARPQHLQTCCAAGHRWALFVCLFSWAAINPTALRCRTLSCSLSSFSAISTLPAASKTTEKWTKSPILLLHAAVLTLTFSFLFRSCQSDQHAPGHLRPTEAARHHPLPGRRQPTSDIGEMGERWLSSQSGEGQAFTEPRSSFAREQKRLLRI